MTAARWIDHMGSGVAASIPAAGDVPINALYEETDTGFIRQSNGSTWQVWARTVPPGGTTDQVLTKESDDDFDVGWEDAGGGGGGGGGLDALRLPSIADDGTGFGASGPNDDLEYADQTALEAIWTPRSSTAIVAAGSSAVARLFATGDGIYRDASGYASSFEDAWLVSGHQDNAGMVGPFLTNGSGNGLAFSPYSDGNSYIWNILADSYNSTGSAGGVAYTAWQDGRPVWFALRFNGSVYRLRWSEDGSSWTSIIAAGAGSAVSGLSRAGFGRHNGGVAPESLQIHAYAHGEPDLGI